MYTTYRFQVDLLVPVKGFEPSRLSTSDFKSDSSTYSDTPANIKAAIYMHRAAGPMVLFSPFKRYFGHTVTSALSESTNLW